MRRSQHKGDCDTWQCEPCHTSQGPLLGRCGNNTAAHNPSCLTEGPCTQCLEDTSLLLHMCPSFSGARLPPRLQWLNRQQLLLLLLLPSSAVGTGTDAAAVAASARLPIAAAHPLQHCLAVASALGCWCPGVTQSSVVSSTHSKGSAASRDIA